MSERVRATDFLSGWRHSNKTRLLDYYSLASRTVGGGGETEAGFIESIALFRTMSSTTPTAPAATSSATTSASSPDYNSKFREKDLNSASCRKCVQVLQEIISGLHANNNNNSIEKNYSSTTNSHHPTTVGGTHQTSDPHRESLPLTLLKAIAETGGSSSSSSTSNLSIQETHDGVRVEIPVTTSLPVMLRRWSSMVRSNHRSGSERQIDDEERERDDKELHSLQTLATSSSSPMSPTTSLPPCQFGRGWLERYQSCQTISTQSIGIL